MCKDFKRHGIVHVFIQQVIAGQLVHKGGVVILCFVARLVDEVVQYTFDVADPAGDGTLLFAFQNRLDEHFDEMAEADNLPGVAAFDHVEGEEAVVAFAVGFAAAHTDAEHDAADAIGPADEIGIVFFAAGDAEAYAGGVDHATH